MMLSDSVAVRQLIQESDEEDQKDCREWVSRFTELDELSFCQNGEQQFAIGHDGAWEPAIVSDTWAQVER